MSKYGKPLGRKPKEQPKAEHWAERVKRMYEDGYSDEEVCKDIQISRKEFLRRIKEDPMFAKLIEYGHVARKAWYLRIGRKAVTEGAKPQSFNFWQSIMKNDFGWGAESATESKPAQELTGVALAERIAELSKKLKESPGVSDLVN